MTVIRHARIGDCDLLMRRVNASFSENNPTHPLPPDMFPDLIRPEEALLAQWLVAEDEGQVVAGLQIAPRTLVAASDNCRAGGAPDVDVTLQELARLLFGPCPPDLGVTDASMEVLRRAFPLPVYWHPLSHV